MACCKTKRLAKSYVSLFVFFLVLAQLPLRGQPISILHSFTGSPDGANPQGGMLLLNDTLYGAVWGGSNGTGVIFSIGTNGSNYAILHTFGTNLPITGQFQLNYTNSDGGKPLSQLAVSGGTLFGMCQTGGTNANGAIFSLNTDGSGFSLLHAFEGFRNANYITNVEGGNPTGGGLTLGGGTLFGATSVGGTVGAGTLFSLDATGSNFAVIHTFSSGKVSASLGSITNADGAGPQNALILAGDTLFGVCSGGGTNGRGTVFSIGTNGSNYTVLHHFAKGAGGFYPSLTNADGTGINGSLLLSGDTLYGTAYEAGLKGYGAAFSINTDGSGFTVLHTFSGHPDGTFINGDLIMIGTTLYGTAMSGGPTSGAIFSMNTNGANFRMVHSFAGPDGVNASGGLINVGNLLFGTAEGGGPNGLGSIFSLAIPSVVSSITPNPDASVTLTFAGAPFYTYLVQASVDLTSPTNWIIISTNTAGADGTWQFNDTNASLFPTQFYRAVAPQ
jgi:uncharacterized repeat protein (TIGR03803 family)